MWRLQLHVIHNWCLVCQSKQEGHCILILNIAYLLFGLITRCQLPLQWVELSLSGLLSGQLCLPHLFPRFVKPVLVLHTTGSGVVVVMKNDIEKTEDILMTLFSFVCCWYVFDVWYTPWWWRSKTKKPEEKWQHISLSEVNITMIYQKKCIQGYTHIYSLLRTWLILNLQEPKLQCNSLPVKSRRSL